MADCVIGIDPGPASSGWCMVSPEKYEIIDAGKNDNTELLELLKLSKSQFHTTVIACESIQSYGAPVGKETFETCYMIGEIRYLSRIYCYDINLIPRPEYARYICGAGKFNDATLRQALLLRFGGDRKNEPLHKLKGSSDKRSAYAVAVYYIDKNRNLPIHWM